MLTFCLYESRIKRLRYLVKFDMQKGSLIIIIMSEFFLGFKKLFCIHFCIKISIRNILLS
ncbi:hypothetical protein OIU77_002437 [Salix suchowensis]|uniref:Uncharacterized protein n=1 Tax=Salix suchowensis TaxID=1278906 RepID=A0ABQ8ZG21_9ROSI|nr:hypothetical protein OIU77_002437 [Salix suchowensis]